MHARKRTVYKRFSAPRLNIPQTAPMQNACLHGVPAEIIATLLEVDISTARRWKSGKSKMMPALSVYFTGDLGRITKHLSGWWVSPLGEMVGPDGWRFDRNAIMASRFSEAQLSAMKEQISALEAQIAELKEMTQKQEQPAPEELPALKLQTVVA